MRIDTADDLRFNPHRVAELIAAYVKQKPQDVLILGRQSSVGDNAQTPLILAEILGWPCITQVVKVELDPHGLLCVTNQQDDGLMQQVIETPCVLAIGNAQITTMRVPTLKDKMAYGKRPIDVIPAEELITTDKGAAANQKIRLLKLENVDNQRAGVVVSQGSLEEKAQYLYDHFLKERLQKL